jgi:imidazoleglycerol-phosphate dehydratase
MNADIRSATVSRATAESSVEVHLVVDGTGTANVSTGIGFLDHMLVSFAKHGLFDLTVKAKGDTHVDSHHTAEDVAITLGRAFAAALGDRAGIVRMAQSYVPLDEALARAVVDIGGRGYAVFTGEFAAPIIGDLDADMIRHFVESLAVEGRMNVHVDLLRGINAHHQAEAAMKARARALDAATRLDPRLEGRIPSAKGVIDQG